MGRGQGLETIRKRWLARAAGLGGQVAVRVDGAVVRGIFETIDADCRFVIRDETGAHIRIAPATCISARWHLPAPLALWARRID